MQNVTVTAPKDEMLFSQYGFVSFREWCFCEAGRINRGVGREVAKVVSEGDKCHVARIDRSDEGVSNE